MAFGRPAASVRADGTPEEVIAHKVMEGNRPSSMLMLDELTPFALGSLVALYEHLVFVQGAVWGIDSFDQWGVELGKVMAQRIIPTLTGEPIPSDVDSSTSALIERYRELR